MEYFSKLEVLLAEMEDAGKVDTNFGLAAWSSGLLWITAAHLHKEICEITGAQPMFADVVAVYESIAETTAILQSLPEDEAEDDATPDTE